MHGYRYIQLITIHLTGTKQLLTRQLSTTQHDVTMRKLEENRLYRRNGNYSAIRSKAIRLGYPFTITQKEFAAIVPIVCHYGHLGIDDGLRMILDTIRPELGFCVGNTILVCTRHLGGRNKQFDCSNNKELLGALSKPLHKPMTSNQI